MRAMDDAGISRGQWRIELVERPVRVSAHQDIAWFGRHFSHPFLVLKNPCGGVEREMHVIGRLNPPDKTTEISLDLYTGQFFHESAIKPLVALLGARYPLCRIFDHAGRWQYNDGLIQHGLHRDNRFRVEDCWQRLCDTMDALNAAAKPYHRYAQRGAGFSNCQIILRTAMERAGFKDIPALALAQTGWMDQASPIIASP